MPRNHVAEKVAERRDQWRRNLEPELEQPEAQRLSEAMSAALARRERATGRTPTDEQTRRRFRYR